MKEQTKIKQQSSIRLCAISDSHGLKNIKTSRIQK